MQKSDAVSASFEMRTKDFHDTIVREQTNDSEDDYGVKQSCVLSDHLSYFHPITGFPPDILHDLFEGPHGVGVLFERFDCKEIFHFGGAE